MLRRVVQGPLVEWLYFRLAANAGIIFQGSIVLGNGFILETDEARRLLDRDHRNREVVVPFLNGEDLTTRVDQTPSRFVINFRDWNLAKASEYPECLEILTQRVKPERDLVVQRGKQIHEYDYWKFWDTRLDSYAMIQDLPRVIALPCVSKFLLAAFVDANAVFSHALDIVATADVSFLALLQSNIHEVWTRVRGSTLETRLRYTPTDCFETFPFPSSMNELEAFGFRYDESRGSILRTRQEGLTRVYNRFHNAGEKSEDLAELRALHAEMDQAVATAYGWSDLDLGHRFRETKQGERYTISESARREVLDRLLQLNHERYAEEVRLGWHEKKRGKVKKREKSFAVAKSEASSEVKPQLFE